MKKNISKYTESDYDSRFPYDFKNDKIIIKELLKKAKVVANSNILDVGCGEGVYTNFIANEGMSVIGIDLSKKLLEIGKNSYKNINFIGSDVFNLPFKNNYYKNYEKQITYF